MTDPTSNIRLVVIAKRLETEKEVLKILRELKATSKETAQKPNFTNDQLLAVKNLKKQGKILETSDKRWYISP